MVSYDYKQITDVIFKNKILYGDINPESKEKNFFIINRIFSKKYPLKANSLNKRVINENYGDSALDIWFNFFKNDRIMPKWMFERVDSPKKRTDYKDDIMLYAKYHSVDYVEASEYKTLFPNEFIQELNQIKLELNLITPNKK